MLQQQQGQRARQLQRVRALENARAEKQVRCLSCCLTGPEAGSSTGTLQPRSVLFSVSSLEQQTWKHQLNVASVVDLGAA